MEVAHVSEMLGTAHHPVWCQSLEQYRLISIHCIRIIMCSIPDSQLTE